MRILVACECSGIVREAFRKRGHDAWSCDIQETEIPGPHYQQDIFRVIDKGWDLMIGFPPCTYLSYVGNRHWNNFGREEKRREAMSFFLALYNSPIPRVCLENPLGYPCRVFRKPDQIIHPYFWGDSFKKRTCLWLKNLKPLSYAKEDTLFEKATACSIPKPLYFLSTTGKAINFVEGISGMNKNERQKARSRFWPGIAKAMAEQWG